MIDLVEQRPDLGGVIDTTIGQRGSHDPATGRVHADMQDPPRAPPFGAVLFNQSLPRPAQLQSRAVHQQMQRLAVQAGSVGAPQVFHLPASLGQPGADPPVVDVSAGRLAGIVETLGDYYVDSHDAPAVESACRTEPASSLQSAADLDYACRRSVTPDTG